MHQNNTQPWAVRFYELRRSSSDDESKTKITKTEIKSLRKERDLVLDSNSSLAALGQSMNDRQICLMNERPNERIVGAERNRCACYYSPCSHSRISLSFSCPHIGRRQLGRATPSTYVRVYYARIRRQRVSRGAAPWGSMKAATTTSRNFVMWALSSKGNNALVSRDTISHAHPNKGTLPVKHLHKNPKSLTTISHSYKNCFFLFPKYHQKSIKKKQILKLS